MPAHTQPCYSVGDGVRDRKGCIVAKSVDKLTDLKVKKIVEPGRYGDGGLLVLNVGPSGGKSWLVRYRQRSTGRIVEMGLGSVRDVPLKLARERAAEARASLAGGGDPLFEKRQKKAAAALAVANSVTFGECAEAYAASLGSAWRSPRHRAQWVGSLTKNAKRLRSLPVALIDTAAVLLVLKPLWATSIVTGRKVQQRIAATLDYAAAIGYRTKENPARWRGHLDKLLAKPSSIHTVEHLASLPYAALPALMRRIRATDSTVARLTEFVILTACRVSEAANATWSEIDDANVWTIPPERTKANREHRVPLVADAVAVLDQMVNDAPLVFHRTGPSGPRALYVSAPLNFLHGLLGNKLATVHGFRSSFREWAAEQTDAPREVAELCLAHNVKTVVESAYQRSDLLEKRRELMNKWAIFLAS